MLFLDNYQNKLLFFMLLMTLLLFFFLSALSYAHIKKKERLNIIIEDEEIYNEVKRKIIKKIKGKLLEKNKNQLKKDVQNVKEE